MQKRTWLWLLVTALVAAALHFSTRRGSPPAIPTAARPVPAPAQPAPAATAAAPVRAQATSATPAASAPPVAIEDQKTIDFSSGQPEVRDTAADKAALDAAVKEMAAAAKDVTFGPAKP